MKVEKITGRRDYMDVHFDDGRVARFIGELIVGGFVAFTSSLREWKEPEGAPITDEEKEEIINAVKERQKESKMKILLEQ